ncbi:AHH domain-containing protein [Myxococcus sp. Y35]|uniref:AHH domain-containing protein n=1 Tax=Pseudomyxococcus flavus TaxID=3115648 RepID=UPI003CF3BF46
MPNQFDGATGPAGGQVKQAEEAQRKKCKWSNCEGHEKDLNPEYRQGNVARQGQKLRDNLLAKNLEPWNGGGHGETNIRKMYLDQRKDGVITPKADTYPYRIEAHHILPVETVESTSTLKDNAVLAGWDINDLSNGMMLPKDEMDVALHRLQQHNGSHPGSYTKPINERLQSIEEFYENACQDKEDVAMQLALGQALQMLSNTVRDKIVNIRQHASGKDYMGLHLDALVVFRSAVQTLEDRRQRYMEQQRQQIFDNTQRKTS